MGALTACRALVGAAAVAVACAAMAGQKLRPADAALARDYVLASCLMHRYPSTSLATEADAWATGLVEQGTLNAEAYPALAALARSAPEPGSTRDGITMRLQSCVDFVHARDFPARLQRALKR